MPSSRVPGRACVKSFMQDFCCCRDTHDEPYRFGGVTPKITAQQISFRIVGDNHKPAGRQLLDGCQHLLGRSEGLVAADVVNRHFQQCDRLSLKRRAFGKQLPVRGLKQAGVKNSGWLKLPRITSSGRLRSTLEGSTTFPCVSKTTAWAIWRRSSARHHARASWSANAEPFELDHVDLDACN